MDEHLGLDLADHARLATGIAEKLAERLGDENLYAAIKPEGALAAHCAIKELLGAVRDAMNEADRLLIASLDGEKKAVIGDKIIEVRRSYSRTWDHPMVLGAIAGSVLQGERIVAVDNVLTAIEQALGKSTQWKTGALKSLGIDPDKGMGFDDESRRTDGEGVYCTRELGRATVSVVG